MTTQQPTISVVICAYTEERWDDLVDAVTSVRWQTCAAHQVIVVIDHNPALFKRVREELGGVIALENSGPRGLSAARNSGIATATGDVIAFIDDDAQADPDWVAAMAAWYADESVIGVGGPVKPAWSEGRPAWFPEEFDWVVGCTFRGMPETAQPVQRLIGCNMSFRREVFDVVGGFRSGIGRVGSYPIAGEETELSIKVGQHWPQRRLMYDPRVWVGHRVPAKRATFAYFRTRSFCEGVSKALVAGQVGSRDGLAAERTYTSRTLPMGVLAGLGAAVRGDLSGLGRAGAIVAGLAITVAGYGRGSLARLREGGAAIVIPQAAMARDGGN
jgi:hypothetical protein